MNTYNDFLVNRSDFSKVSIDPIKIPTGEQLQAGQVLLRVDHFALTANNITYAAMGDVLQYWNFFPKKEGWGNIPVWGFADVLESECEGIGAGERLYGYFPMSTHLVVQPQHITPNSFVDAAEHRQSLSIIYNQYIRVAQDDLYTPETEALQMLLRPLFTTSFLLDDFFNDQDFFAANSIVLTSASSKTALGMAFLLKHHRQERNRDYEVIGLTSSSNSSFVSGLDCYDRVLTYDQLSQLNQDKETVVVDFAGNGEVLGKLHAHFTEMLQYSCLVGASHWDQRSGMPSNLPGPQPQMFFAPSQAEKRVKEWGNHSFQKKIAEAWSPFVQFVDKWIDIDERKGADAVSHVYQEVLAGKFKPSKGYILTMWDE